MLHLDWSEHDGPAVQAPLRRGFGSKLIERSIRVELQGSIETAFSTEGLQVSIRVPLMRERGQTHAPSRTEAGSLKQDAA